ncbi:MAG: DUF1211 domain-containing protein [Bacteroidetes bacterium]|nr:DUF1211 domain-containing protein [Bacteroidota bacterium]
MLRKQRIEALTDGVIAIVITLMVLEIKAPYINGNIDMGALILQIVTYGFSFLIIAIIWLNHYHLLTNAAQLSTKQIWINYMLLFCISLIPLPTRELGEHFGNPNSHALYGVVLGLTSVFYSLFHWAIDDSIKHIHKTERKKFSIKNWSSVVLYFSASIFSYLSVYVSASIFILIPMLYFIPSRKILSPNEI